MEPIYKKSTVDLAVEKLIEYIQGDEVEAGQKLPAEVWLCRELNISRTTIREAYRVLQSQGYLEIRAGKGAFVKSKERDFIQEATEWISTNSVLCSDYLYVRIALDPMVARLAAQNATEEDIQDLHTIHQAFLETVKGQDSEKLTRLDEEFHERIAQSTGNDLLVSLVRITSHSCRILRQNSFCFEEHVNHAVSPHEKILQAIIDRKPERAAQASIDHMVRAFEDLCGCKPQL